MQSNHSQLSDWFAGSAHANHLLATIEVAGGIQLYYTESYVLAIESIERLAPWLLFWILTSPGQTPQSYESFLCKFANAIGALELSYDQDKEKDDNNKSDSNKSWNLHLNRKRDKSRLEMKATTFWGFTKDKRDHWARDLNLKRLNLTKPNQTKQLDLETETRAMNAKFFEY